MIHTIVFDIGNTLIESRDVFDEILSIIGPNKKEIKEFMRKRFIDIYRKCETDEFLNVPGILSIVLRDASKEFGIDDISERSGEIYENNYINNSQLFDDSMFVLEELKKRNMRIIAASDADKNTLLTEMKKFGIIKFFDKIIISSEIGSYKPSDIMVSEILKACKEPISEILFVGDTEADMITAKKMGSKSVLISRNDTESGIDADYMISSLKEILDLITK